MFWLAAAACVWAQNRDFTEIPNLLPATISFDEKGGEYGRNGRSVDCKINTVSALVRLTQTHPDEKWAPVAQLVLNQSKPKEKPPADKQSIHLVIMGHGGDRVAGQLDKFVGTELKERRRFSSDLQLDKDIALFLTWKDGVATATIDGESNMLPIDQPITSVDFIVSGAKADFSNVQLGYSTAPSCTTP